MQNANNQEKQPKRGKLPAAGGKLPGSYTAAARKLPADVHSTFLESLGPLGVNTPL
jgi:hypothetical protein